MRARFPEFILARRNGVRWLWLPLAEWLELVRGYGAVLSEILAELSAGLQASTP